MYVAVVSVTLGQALLFGNAMLLAYAGLVWLLFHIFVLAYEEPILRKKFGSEYEPLRRSPEVDSSPFSLDSPPEATRP